MALGMGSQVHISLEPLVVGSHIVMVAAACAHHLQPSHEKPVQLASRQREAKKPVVWVVQGDAPVWVPRVVEPCRPDRAKFSIPYPHTLKDIV